MARVASSHPPASAWRPGSPEALRVAGALRHARLTLLCGDAGAGRTALLVDGVLPLLRRRMRDAGVSIASARRMTPGVLPFPERRREAGSRLAEIVVHMATWNDATAGAVHERIDAGLRSAGVEPEWHRTGLAERVEGLCSRFGLRFLFVFDAFEDFLAAPQGADRFDDELVELLNLPVQAHTLISLRSDALALCEPFRERVHGTHVEVLSLVDGRLLPDPAAGPRLQSVPVPMPVPKPVPKPASKPAPDESEAEPQAAAAPIDAAAPAEPILADAVARNPGAAPHTAETPSGERRPASKPKPKLTPIAWRSEILPVVGIALIGAALHVLLEAPPAPGRPPAAAPPPINEAAPGGPAVALPMPPAARPAVAAPAAALPAAPAGAQPTVELLVATGASAASQLPAELARALGVAGGVDVRVRSIGSADALRALAAPGARVTGPSTTRAATLAETPTATLTIARYDALQAAARDPAAPPIAVVTALYTEDLAFVVRADSALDHIHQIEGLRINGGPAASARALTVDAVHRRMFGAAPSMSAPEARLDAPAALQQLASGRTLDVVLLVMPQPAAWLAGLSPELRRSIKLLALDPGHPASRRALQAYLPATLAGAALALGPAAAGARADVPTLASMAFLVTTAAPDPARADTLARLAEALCRSLPALQRDGDPKWRQVRPGTPLPIPVPYALAESAAWDGCTPASAPTRAPASPAR